MVNLTKFNIEFRNWFKDKGGWFYLEQIANSDPRNNEPWPGCLMEKVVKLVPGIHIDAIDEDRTIVLDSYVAEVKDIAIQADLQKFHEELQIWLGGVGGWCFISNFEHDYPPELARAGKRERNKYQFLSR